MASSAVRNNASRFVPFRSEPQTRGESFSDSWSDLIAFFPKLQYLCPSAGLKCLKFTREPSEPLRAKTAVFFTCHGPRPFSVPLNTLGPSTWAQILSFGKCNQSDQLSLKLSPRVCGSLRRVTNRLAVVSDGAGGHIFYCPLTLPTS